MPQLLAEVERFRAWADATRPPGQRGGEWECDYEKWGDFYDAVLQPVIGSNAYAAGAADAPNRLFVQGRAMPGGRWLVLGTLDWRTGLPYSVVNEMLDFVGPRNELRFPTYVRLDAGLERRLSVMKVHPWVGLRVANALNSFLPLDVQANTGASDFGHFYNSPFREYRIHVRFEK